MKIRNAILMMVLCLVAQLSWAESFGDYHTRSKKLVLACETNFYQLQIYATILRHNKNPQEEPPMSMKACVEQASEAAKLDYRNMVKFLPKGKKEAAEALKNYHVKVLLTIQGAEPQSGERMIDYERRFNALKKDMEEAYIRFDLEM